MDYNLPLILKGHNFINCSKTIAINSYGDIFKVGDFVKHLDPDAGQTDIIGFSIDENYSAIKVDTVLGYAYIDFIQHIN
jgi:hypothetical protein